LFITVLQYFIAVLFDEVIHLPVTSCAVILLVNIMLSCRETLQFRSVTHTSVLDLMSEDFMT